MYKIDGKEYSLKELTLDEADEVAAIIERLNAGTPLANDARTLVQTLLSPKLEDPGKCPEAVLFAVVKDFFLRRLETQRNLTLSLRTLTSELPGQGQSTEV